MSLRTRERNFRLLLRGLSIVAIVVGILSLLGVRPMNSRTIEVVLGTASLVMGLALWALTMRARSANPPTSIA
jgi:uncharacterized membrane protein HdeD (DUF308 family)